jgi:hypothetical protein
VSILDKYSSFNHFQVFSGKNNSFSIKSGKYILTRKELCLLFVKHLTKDDINKIVKYLELESDDYLFVIKKCFLLIDKAYCPNGGNIDYKDLFMERVLLDSCYSAIVLLKILEERRKKDTVTEYELSMLEELISMELSQENKQFLHNIQDYYGRYKKLYKWQIRELHNMYKDIVNNFN